MDGRLTCADYRPARLSDNPVMHSLRQARLLVRLIAVWFVLSIGAAIASPLVKPQAMELVCSGGGVVKLLIKSDDGSSAMASHTLDCPLCASLSAPPPAVRLGADPVSPLTHVMQAIPAARIASLTAAPLPARGPPSRS
jgi:hypothetical protein